MRQVKKDSTNVSVDVYIIDSTDGTPETGVVFNTSGIDLSYRRDFATVSAITEADLTTPALDDAHEDGGFLDVGFGLYRLDVPDAAFATGASKVTITGTVTGMIVLPTVIQLVDFDPDDAVRMGLTSLPNAAAEASGGLYTRGTGAGQINQANNGEIDVDVSRVNGGANAAARLRRLFDATSSGTAQAGAAGTITLASGDSAVDDFHKGSRILLNSGTGLGQHRIITGYTGSTKVAIISPNWVTTPDGTSQYLTMPAVVDVEAWAGDGPNALVSGRVDADQGAKTGNVALSAQEKLDVNTEADTALTDAALATTADLLDKLGAVNEAAAAGDPSATESVMQYVKQIVNVLMGTTGITTMPAGAAPADNVSIAEMVRAIYDDTNNLDGTKIPDTISLANINGEVVDVLKTDTVTLPGQVAPPLTPTFEEMISWLYKNLRNRKDQTSTLWQLYADNETTVDAKATVSDDGTTAIKQEIVTGP